MGKRSLLEEPLVDDTVFIRTATAGSYLARESPTIDGIRRALLSTVDGHRSVVELESVARAMGLGPSALEQLRMEGLIERVAATTPPCRMLKARPGSADLFEH